MTGLALSEMKTAADLELAVAHLVSRWLILETVANSTRIWAFLHFTDEEVAIIELRGGTHLMLSD